MADYHIKQLYALPLKTRLLIVVLLFAIVFYIGYAWDLAGLKTKIANNHQQEDTIKQQLALVISQEEATKHFVSELWNFQSSLNRWKKKLITHVQLPELLNEILKYGSGNHIYFDLFNPGDETMEQQYVKIPIKVIAIGTYHQLADFISQVANMPWIVVVSNFTISSKDDTNALGTQMAEIAKSENLLTAEMTLVVYMLPQGDKL